MQSACGACASTILSTLSLKMHDFREESYRWNAFRLSLQRLLQTQTVHILREEFSDIITNLHIHAMHPLFLSNFNQIWIFSIDFRNILECQIQWKKFFHWELSYSVQNVVFTNGHTWRGWWSIFAILQTRLKGLRRYFSFILACLRINNICGRYEITTPVNCKVLTLFLNKIILKMAW
jgi:hypothetical protein